MKIKSLQNVDAMKFPAIPCFSFLICTSLQIFSNDVTIHRQCSEYLTFYYTNVAMTDILIIKYMFTALHLQKQNLIREM